MYEDDNSNYSSERQAEIKKKKTGFDQPVKKYLRRYALI
jgi:hypothetical protein